MDSPDDCAECARGQVDVLWLREAGGGHVGGQPRVPVQVEHGDVVARLGLEDALVVGNGRVIYLKIQLMTLWPNSNDYDSNHDSLIEGLMSVH